MDTKQKLRNEILRNLEKNSRIDLGELAVLMGMEEAEIANEVAEMEIIEFETEDVITTSGGEIGGGDEGFGD